MACVSPASIPRREGSRKRISTLGGLLVEPPWEAALKSRLWKPLWETTQKGLLGKPPQGTSWQSALGGLLDKLLWVRTSSGNRPGGLPGGAALDDLWRTALQDLLGKPRWGTSLRNPPGRPPGGTCLGGASGKPHGGSVWKTTLGGLLGKTPWEILSGSRPEKTPWKTTLGDFLGRPPWRPFGKHPGIRGRVGRQGGADCVSDTRIGPRKRGLRAAGKGCAPQARLGVARPRGARGRGSHYAKNDCPSAGEGGASQGRLASRKQ